MPPSFLGPHRRGVRELARFCGVKRYLGVANETDAVELSLRGLGVGAGHDVIIPANTYIATAEAVLRAGANVVLADVTPDYLLDPVSG